MSTRALVTRVLGCLFLLVVADNAGNQAHNREAA